VSETSAVICDISPSGPLAWPGKAQVITISVRKCGVNIAPKDRAHCLKVYKLLEYVGYPWDSIN
jgi:hypothetical protein